MERIKLAIEKARAEGGVATARAPAQAVQELRPVSVPLDDDDMSRHQTSDLGHQTAIVSLDAAHLERSRVVAHQKGHPASWAFDLLRTQVLQRMEENGWRTVAITSPTIDAGKTLLAINLAIGIAQQTQRTALLVDFDLRRPRVASTLGISRSVSLNQVLAGKAQVADALVNPGIQRLVVLPTMGPEDNASELLSSQKTQALITELKNRYQDRTVIFDLPPALVADDVLAVLPHVDCVILVVASGGSTEAEIEETMARLKRFPILGVVLNKDDSPSRNDYYY